MESTDISLKLTDLAALSRQVLSSDRALEQLYGLFTNNGNILEDHAAQRHIPSGLLRTFFDRVVDFDKYIDLFIAFLDLSDDSSITADLFDYILACNDPYLCSRCVVSFSHKNLPVALLVRLCKTNMSFESYFELILKVYQDTSYSVEDLSQYLLMFYDSPYRNMWPELVREVLSNDASSTEKKQLITNQTFQTPLR